MRVRSPGNLYLDTLYAHFLLEAPTWSASHAARIITPPSREYAFVSLERETWRMVRRLLAVAALRPKFFCINDHLAGNDATVVRLLQWFLGFYFPHPSPFERF